MKVPLVFSIHDIGGSAWRALVKGKRRETARSIRRCMLTEVVAGEGMMITRGGEDPRPVIWAC